MGQSFPFEAGQKAYAAKLVVEYFNADKIGIATDQAWVMKDSYTYPTYLIKEGGYKHPVIIKPVEKMNMALNDFGTYSFTLPGNYLTGLNNLYLHMNYNGDKGRLYFNHRLIADDFNNGDTWNTGLNRFGNILENQPLRVELYPLSNYASVYFDDEATKQAATKAVLKNIQLIPEYEMDLIIEGSGLRKNP